MDKQELSMKGHPIIESNFILMIIGICLSAYVIYLYMNDYDKLMRLSTNYFAIMIIMTTLTLTIVYFCGDQILRNKQINDVR